MKARVTASAAYTVAELVAGTPDLPGEVAVALQALLGGNVQKVLISIGIWLPYLLLSKRVNVTYRHRVPAQGTGARSMTDIHLSSLAVTTRPRLDRTGSR